MTLDSRTSEGTDDRHWEALARFHAGESAPEEAERMRRHLATHADDRLLLELLDAHQADALSRETSDALDIDNALVAVRRRLIALDAPGTPTLDVSSGSDRTDRPRAPARASFMRRSAVAAAALAAVAVAVSQWPARVTVDNVFTSTPAVHETASKQRDSLVLADGSRIMIAPDSRITVDSGFGRSHRTVMLEGVAHFTVAHEGSHPFIVRTQGVDVRDIGTAFVVRAAKNGQVVVSVTDGQVRVTRTGQTATVDLFAGDRAVIPASGDQPTVERNASAGDDAAWTEGRLVYRDARLADVLSDMKRWYGVEVHADSTLLRRTLQAEFSTDSLAQALRIVSLVLGAETVERGGAVYLEQRGGTRTR